MDGHLPVVQLRAADDSRADLTRLLVDVVRRIGGTLDLHGTLEQVTRAVVDLLGFQVAVMNLVTPDGEHLEVTTVTGPAATQALLGTRMLRSDWTAVLDACEPWGTLRFADSATPWPESLPFWLPDLPVVDGDDGAWHPEDALFAPLVDTTGELLGVLSVDLPTDGRRPGVERRELLEIFSVQAGLVVEQARLHTQLQRSQAVFQRAFEHAPVGMAVFGPDRRLSRANPAYCRFLGRTEQDLIGRTAHEFSHPDETALTDTAGRQVRGGSADVDGVLKRYLHTDGRVVWGRVTLTWLDGEAGGEVLAHLEDVTDARAAAEDLEHRASSDPLTGLANRDRFDAVLRARLVEGGPPVAVLFCDVDRFKLVNDTLGHAAGDALLRRIAQDVSAVLRGRDLAARLGGDEFVVLLDDVEDEVQALAVAERVRTAVSAAAQEEGRTVGSTMTIGVAISNPASSARSLLARADQALYAAKQDGRDRVALAEDE